MNSTGPRIFPQHWHLLRVWLYKEKGIGTHCTEFTFGIFKKKKKKHYFQICTPLHKVYLNSLKKKKKKKSISGPKYGVSTLQKEGGGGGVNAKIAF